MDLFTFGLGYSATAALRLLCPERAAGTTRSAEAAARFAGLADPMLFDGRTASADIAARLGGANHLLVSIAPDETGQDGDRVLKAFGETLSGCRFESVVYLSTVGVYGDHAGAWVDETSECRPTSARSRARVAAEAAWAEFGRSTGTPVAILRLAGIYGPGRNSFVQLANGTAKRLIKPGQVFNRIHVDDIATAIASAFAVCADGLFNITDDEPAPPQDVVTHAAALMGVAPPPVQDYATAELTPMARSFYGENKRVSNARSKTVLGMTYRYPTYREALAALWTSGTWR